MNYYEKIEAESIAELKKLLAKPVSADMSSEDFDPWDIFPFYGSYSSDFDEMALETLTDILNGTYLARKEFELGREMFREILCNKELCEYGTSPRTCWANESFKELLPEYIDKWRHYFKLQWGEEYVAQS